MTIASLPEMAATTRKHPQWECTWCGRKWSWVQGVEPNRDRRKHVICGACARPTKNVGRGVRITRIPSQQKRTLRNEGTPSPEVAKLMANWHRRVSDSRRVR